MAMRAGPKKHYPTALETYRDCPFKYRCGQDPEIKEKYRRPTPEQFVGTCVHDALEVFFDVRRTPMGQRTREHLANLLRRAWAGVDLTSRRRREREEERRRVFGDDRENEAAYGKHGLTLLDRYFNITDRTVVPYTAEQFHETALPSGIVVAGKIDRIDKMPDGSLKVVDYKTGKLPFRTDDESVAKEDLQLSTYAIVVTGKYRLPVSRCVLVFLAHDREVGFCPTPELLEEKARVIEETVRQIEADREFAPRENPLCPWCDYREICPIGKDIAPADRVRETPDVPF